MKKLLFAGILSVFLLGITSCGGRHICDAFHKSDYTKVISEKKQSEVKVEKTKTIKKS